MWNAMQLLWHPIGTLIAFVFGTIFGVIVDRLWQYFESRPAVELRFSWFQELPAHEGVQYEIRNVGFAEIPEYKLEIRGRRGSVDIFPTTASGALLPDQTRLHKCVLSRNGVRDLHLLGMLKMLEHDDPKLEHVRVQLTLIQSDRVLFRDHSLAIALLAELKAQLQNDKTGRNDWYYRLNYFPRWNIKSWLRRRQQVKEFNEVIGPGVPD